MQLQTAAKTLAVIGSSAVKLDPMGLRYNVAKSAIPAQQLAVNWRPRTFMTKIRMRCLVTSCLRVLKAHNPL